MTKKEIAISTFLRFLLPQENNWRVSARWHHNSLRLYVVPSEPISIIQLMELPIGFFITFFKMRSYTISVPAGTNTAYFRINLDKGTKIHRCFERFTEGEFRLSAALEYVESGW